MIEIIVNGEKREINSGLNINQLILELKYEEKWFAIAVNNTFVAIDTYENTIVKNNDRIEILAPVQGG